MTRLSTLALNSESDAYMEGGEAGFWRGFSEGAAAAVDYVMGREGSSNPHDMIPDQFRPRGYDWYPVNHHRTKP